MILVTGAAGFIGYHVAEALLARGETVLGLDNLNAYYDVRLKEKRLERLRAKPGFAFLRHDIADRALVELVIQKHAGIDRIVHLAAQAGVRHARIDPYAYVSANVMGHVVMSEIARRLPGLRHFVYASSSSVYGGNAKLPFAPGDPVERPVSLYAATKRADELMAQAYSHLFALPSTGLRFFTVYGPWGRPDMAAFLFTKAIAEGRPITVFNRGQMERDFTYIDDIAAGVVAALDRPPPADPAPRHRIYNLGNHRSEKLLDFIAEIERALGKKAELALEAMQPDDVRATFADIEASRRDFGFEPKTPISVGIPRFVAWYKEQYGA